MTFSEQLTRIPNRIFLVGPMGVGKTTVGLQLARILNYTFVDSDKEVEQSTGASIPLIFELEGEGGFRRRESLAIEKLSQLDKVVMATGGGAVLRPENRQILSSHGYVIYLHAPLEQLLARTEKDRNRPLLQTENPRAKLAAIISEREPLYRATASADLDTGAQSLRETIRQLLDMLNAEHLLDEHQAPG